MLIDEVIQRYIVEPYLYSSGYNPVNTLLIGLGLVFVVYVLFWLIRRYKITIDLRFAYALLPFIIFSAFVHVLADAGMYPRLLFQTPLIEFIIGAPALLFVSIMQKFSDNYWRICSAVGWVLTISQLYLYRIVNPDAIILLTVFALASTLIFYVISKRVSFLAGPLVFLSTASHMIDATASFTSLQFYHDIYAEQHVVANIFITLFGPFGMYVMKTVALLPILYVIWRYVDDKRLKNLLLLVILALGLAAGLRSGLRLIMFV